jgi:uncharacterized protein (DUF736 family)
MSNYDDTNRGALFKNADKKADNHPDYKGSINVVGTDFWISAWLKVSKNNQKYMSLSVVPKDGAKPVAKPQAQSDDLSDVPF